MQIFKNRLADSLRINSKPTHVAAALVYSLTVVATAAFASPVNQDLDAPDGIKIAKAGRGPSKTKGAADEDGAFIGFEAETELEKLNKSISEFFKQGKYEDSVVLAKQAVELSLKEYGESHAEYARAVNNLAWHEQALGDFVAARRNFEKALSIQEQLFGKDDPRLATVTNNLGSLLAFQGDYESALPLLEKSLRLEKIVLGEDNSLLAPSMINLANVMTSLGRAADAQPLLKAALDLFAKDPNKDELAYAQSLGAIALFEEQQGDLEGASKHLQEAYALRELKLGKEHPDLSENLINLAMIKASQRKLNEARADLYRAEQILVGSFGPAHVSLANVSGNLARIDLHAGDVSSASKNFKKSAKIVHEHVKNVFSALSFAEQRAFVVSRIPAAMSGMLSTCNETNASEYYGALFQWKGLLVESLRRQNELERLSEQLEVGETVKELQRIRSSFAQLFHRAGKLPFAEWSARTAELISAREALERKIASSKYAADLVDVLSGMSLVDFCGLLKTDEALVDVYRYEKIAANGKENRYAAFVVLPVRKGQAADAQATVRFVDLCSATDIETSISRWRLDTIERRSGQDEWKQLNALIWQKIKPLLPEETKRLVICPDAELSLIPLNLLALENEPMVAQINSPRELAILRTQKQTHSEPETMLITGGLDFGRTQEGDLSVPPLPGTLQEAKRVEKLAQQTGYQTMLLTGRECTRQRFSDAVKNCDHIHLATHGFFQFGGFAKARFEGERNVVVRGARRAPQARDPLASSGIILSAPTEGSPPDIVTAGEMIALDLNRCKTITLSACETGLGTAEPGQGVLGLRASLMAAGARSILMSLWKVPDEATAALMEEYYRGILEKKLPAAESLRLAQNVIKQRGGVLANPYAWGAWVLVGEAW